MIFPQEKQPGEATLSEADGTYTLANDLFTVTFVHDGTTLTFGGCSQMNLLEGSDLFKIKLQSGDEVSSSGMTLGTVTIESLTGDAFAVRGVERFNGKQLVANYTYGGLSIVWRAVLRDGSHYLRTELEISAPDGDVAMESITPMLYTVDTQAAGSAPVVVGNTRGAVIANQKIFAGLETPMGKQKAGSDTGIENFTYNAWTPELFAWIPESVPQGILDLSSNYNAQNIVGARGYVHFTQAGSTTLTFTYASGNHKLDLVGVDLVDPDTKAVVAHDYHYGTMGTGHSNNTYTLEVPAAGAYLVRYFAETYTETLTSSGTIAYSQPVSACKVVYDFVQAGEESYSEATTQHMAPTVPATPLHSASVAPALRRVTSLTDVTADATMTAGGSNVAFTWANGTASTNWPIYTGVPTAVSALQTSAATNRKLSKTVTFSTAGTLTTTITYSSGNHKLNVFGVDLVDANGEVISADYHHGTMGGTLSNNIYTLVAPAGTYTFRILAADYSGDEVNRNAGTATLSLAAIGSVTEAGGETAQNWTNTTWSAASNVPTEITSLTGVNGNNTFAITEARTKSIQTPYAINEGLLNIEVKYLGGSNRIDAVGVELLDLMGNVVAHDYHFGFCGTSKSDNIYQFIVPESGAYYLRYYCSLDNENALPTSGRMNLTLNEPDGKVMETTSPVRHSWTSSNWAAATNVPAGITSLTGNDSGNSYNITAANTKSITGFYYIEAGGMAVEMQYLSGASRLDAVGVELLDLSGNVLAHDYHFGFYGGAQQDPTYHFIVPETGYYLLRYYCSLDKQTALPATGQMNLTVAQAIGTLEETQPTWEGTWQPSSWWDIKDSEVNSRITEAGATLSQVRAAIRSVRLDLPATECTAQLDVNFTYVANRGAGTGEKRLNIYGVELVDGDGSIVASDYHYGRTGTEHVDNNYSLTLAGVNSGDYELRYFVSTQESLNSGGDMAVTLNLTHVIHVQAAATTPIEGVWSRNTTLQQGKTWKVGAVVGLIAQSGTASEAGYTDQSRRSFLAYSERERAVPWRPFPTYISWYELNINRNNSQDYSGNMTVAQCTNVVNQWKANLFDKYDARVKAFVWDDGWDEYGTWDFNPNFPNGFSEPDAVARKMGSGIGAWLGPVGGYGTSGNYRRAYWNNKGGMQLSNPAYYQVFIDACTQMIKDYDFRFFKFDGISDEFSATGPDPDLDITVAEENAEGIIGIEREIRAVKPDIFLNTTVGTWASPFWFQFTDAVWRQENDYGKIGNNTIDRENWITYRDNLVHQNFVTNSPFCPINTLMTHGFILSKYGSVSSYNNYAAIVRELRCAFACGSGMVELYNDYDLTGSVHDDDHPAGSLWKEIADCIAWQEKNADVLPDIHWVGGDPWTGSASEVYGWASWNGRKSTLALRNGATTAQTFTTTLRQALEIPAHVTGSITFSKAFTDQADLTGLVAGTSYNIDATLTLSLPASSVYVFDGVTDGIAETDATDANMAALLLEARRALEQEGIGYPESGADITTGSDARVALAQAITTAAHKAYKPTADDIAALRAAIDAYRQGTTEIQLPEDGHAYQLTTVAEGQQYYLNYDATDGLQLILRAEGTAIPASATFVCHNVDGKTLYVNDAGRYIALTGSALTAAEAYAEGASLLQAVKTESDFGALRLGGSTMAARGWMKVAPRQAGEVTGIEGSTAFSFREAEYPNLVTLRTPTNKDGNSYASICLPFSYIIPDGVTAYRATTLDDENSLVKLVSVKGAVPAGQAVVLVSTEDVSEARLAPAGSEAQEAMTEANNLFRGVCESGIARDQDVTTYVLNGDRSTGNIGFFKYTATNLPAYKAYFTESATNPVRGYLFQFGEATLVLPAAGEAATDGNLPYYDLSGRRTRPDAKGIYIRGGKKVYVK